MDKTKITVSAAVHKLGKAIAGDVKSLATTFAKLTTTLRAMLAQLAKDNPDQKVKDVPAQAQRLSREAKTIILDAAGLLNPVRAEDVQAKRNVESAVSKAKAALGWAMQATKPHAPAVHAESEATPAVAGATLQGFNLPRIDKADSAKRSVMLIALLRAYVKATGTSLDVIEAQVATAVTHMRMTDAKRNKPTGQATNKSGAGKPFANVNSETAAIAAKVRANRNAKK